MPLLQVMMLLLLQLLLFAELVEKVLLLDLLQRCQLGGLEVVTDDGGLMGVQTHPEKGMGLEYALLIEHLGQAELLLLLRVLYDLVLDRMDWLLNHVIDPNHPRLGID